MLTKALQPIFVKIYTHRASAARYNTLQLEVSLFMNWAYGGMAPYGPRFWPDNDFKKAECSYFWERIGGKEVFVVNTCGNSFGGLRVCVTLPLQKPSHSPAQLGTVTNQWTRALPPFPINCDQKKCISCIKRYIVYILYIKNIYTYTGSTLYTWIFTRSVCK